MPPSWLVGAAPGHGRSPSHTRLESLQSLNALLVKILGVV